MCLWLQCQFPRHGIVVVVVVVVDGSVATLPPSMREMPKHRRSVPAWVVLPRTLTRGERLELSSSSSLVWVPPVLLEGFHQIRDGQLHCWCLW